MAIENAPEEFQDEEIVVDKNIQEIEEEQDDVQDEGSYVEDYDPENPTEEQAQALSMGWRPEGVEGKRAVTAAEFVDRQQFFDKIRKQSKEIKELREAFNLQKQADNQARKIQIEKLEQKLRAERKQAIEDNDGERFDEIDEELANLKSEKSELDNAPVVDETAIKEEAQRNFQNWLQDNSWYKEDFEMAQTADKYGEWYARNNPDGYTPEEFYSAINNHVKKKFPEYFGVNTKRTKPAPVSKSTRGVESKTKSKYKVSDLPEGGEEVMKKMIRLKLYDSQEDYLNDFFGNQ